VRFAVIGASGRIGGGIAREALARGHSVTAVVRDGATVDLGDAVEVRRADAFDPASLAAAVGGADIVVSAVGHAASLDDQDFYVRVARALVDTLRPLGDKGPRLLQVGGFGALESAPGVQYADSPNLPDHARPEIAGQRDALAHYRSVTDVRWTYLAPPPGGIRAGERSGRYRMERDRITGDPRDTLISIEDFAVGLVDEAERGEHPHACVGLSRAT